MVAKVRRVVGSASNPAKRRAKKAKRNVKAKRRNSRRRMSAKQIKHFGTKAQKAALKRKRTVTRKKAKPVAKHRKRTKSSTRSNPAHLITLGLAGVGNPQRRKKVAKRKKARRSVAKVKTVRRRRRTTVAKRHRRRNSTRVVVIQARKKGRMNSRRRRGSRNPMEMFGSRSTKDIAKIIAGGLAGVAVTKAAVPMLPASLTSSNAMRTVSSFVVAFAAGFVGRMVDKEFGSAVMFGGFMQAASTGLNAFVPSIGRQIGLNGGRGVGDFVPGSFTVPQNPVLLTGRQGPVAVANGQRRAYGSAY